MQPSIAKHKFLVVESSAETAAVLRQALVYLGAAHVRLVASGAAAQAAFLESPSDIVVMDCDLKGMSGLELTEWIRRSPESPAPGAGVLISMAQPDQARILAARDAGADDIVAKPLDVARLSRKLQSVIARKQTRSMKRPLGAAPPSPPPSPPPELADDEDFEELAI